MVLWALFRSFRASCGLVGSLQSAHCCRGRLAVHSRLSGAPPCILHTFYAVAGLLAATLRRILTKPTQVTVTYVVSPELWRITPSLPTVCDGHQGRVARSLISISNRGGVPAPRHAPRNDCRLAGARYWQRRFHSSSSGPFPPLPRLCGAGRGGGPARARRMLYMAWLFRNGRMFFMAKAQSALSAAGPALSPRLMICDAMPPQQSPMFSRNPRNSWHLASSYVDPEVGGALMHGCRAQ